MVIDALFARPRNIALLIDPDKVTPTALEILSRPEVQKKLSAIFIGGSLVYNDTATLSQKLKQMCNLPVILFPGNLSQVNPHVDAVLFLSLISGRNPEYLIGQHVVAAPIIKKFGIETIPTGYMLFDCGCVNSVRYMSNTLPIPNNKPDIAVATALAGEMLGMKALYLEAGSGAEYPVSTEIIRPVRAAVKIPLIVGGGLRTAEQINGAFEAGANLVVVGTAFETDPDIFEKL